jgi:hypothetical protein
MHAKFKSNQMIRHFFITAIICVTCWQLTAQVAITLKAAVDTALKNNLLLKNEQLKSR